MSLPAKLAYSHLKVNRKRTIWTIAGIVLSAAMLTAVCGFVASAQVMIETVTNKNTYNAAQTLAFYALGAIFGSIIIFASVIVVSNSFRVSAAERTKQFGILKSVGATKRQIAQIILYESLFLSAIAIPIGLALGLFLEFAGTFVITDLLNRMSSEGALNREMAMPFVMTLPMFAISILTSLGTVLLSAWLPARKAAKIAAISAIRASGEIKIKRGKMKTSKLMQKLFGFEGTLAAKSLKRSRRNFRATVVSLTISIVLLIVAGSIGSLMSKVTNLIFPNVDATAVGQFAGSLSITEHLETRNVDAITIENATAEQITQKLREYPDAEIYGVGSFHMHAVALPPAAVSYNMKDFVNPNLGNEGDDENEDARYGFMASIVTVDAKHYAELCKTAGVPLGSSILVNRRVERQEDGKRIEYAPFVLSELKDKPVTLTIGNDEVPVVISGEVKGADVPGEIEYTATADFKVIVPEYDVITYNWFANVPDAIGFAAYAKPIITDMAPEGHDGLVAHKDCVDVAGQTALIRHMVNVIMFFVYGFAGMLTLIALTNVISTIGANVRSRSSEFAVLESVGMTKGGLSRMLNLESILCSVRSLIYGVPLGIIGAYAVYRGMGLAAEVEYSFPWLPVLECCIGVFIVTWVTMRYAASRLRGGSIINAIRAE
ncbi:hypothetical protein FACS1894105_11830 [Clostridia bacterium]|nr:hypothetical protein FACS1894105_11830 [Clostridia bacterium]